MTTEITAHAKVMLSEDAPAPLKQQILGLVIGGIGTDSSHHKQWYLDQIARLILQDGYAAFVKEYEYPNGPAEDPEYEWDAGCCP